MPQVTRRLTVYQKLAARPTNKKSLGLSYSLSNHATAEDLEWPSKAAGNLAKESIEKYSLRS